MFWRNIQIQSNRCILSRCCLANIAKANPRIECRLHNNRTHSNAAASTHATNANHIQNLHAPAPTSAAPTFIHAHAHFPWKLSITQTRILKSTHINPPLSPVRISSATAQTGGSQSCAARPLPVRRRADDRLSLRNRNYTFLDAQLCNSWTLIVSLSVRELCTRVVNAAVVCAKVWCVCTR